MPDLLWKIILKINTNQQFTKDYWTRSYDGHVALCPELDIASQGDTVKGKKSNLAEAFRIIEYANPRNTKPYQSWEVFYYWLEVVG